jgi:hypothetical protein
MRWPGTALYFTLPNLKAAKTYFLKTDTKKPDTFVPGVLVEVWIY